MCQALKAPSHCFHLGSEPVNASSFSVSLWHFEKKVNSFFFEIGKFRFYYRCPVPFYQNLPVKAKAYLHDIFESLCENFLYISLAHNPSTNQARELIPWKHPSTGHWGGCWTPDFLLLSKGDFEVGALSWLLESLRRPGCSRCSSPVSLPCSTAVSSGRVMHRYKDKDTLWRMHN